MGYLEGDRFLGDIPQFGRTWRHAESPDGKHAYLATDADSIVIFERVGNHQAAPP